MISREPAAPARTSRIGASASGTAASASSASGRTGAIAAAITKGSSAHAAYSSRVRWSPASTASVRLPVAASVGISRRLLITSSAQASSPTGTAAASASKATMSICTYAVPATAASPKNRKTETSPSAR